MNFRFGFAAFLLSLLTLGVSEEARAAWPSHPAQNLPISVGIYDQQHSVVVHDGAGGAFVAWEESPTGNFDVFVHHVLRSGRFDPAWPAGGLLGSPGHDHQLFPEMVSDGAGGVFVAWFEFLSDNDVATFVHHVTVAGVDPAWPADGLRLSPAVGDFRLTDIASDGQGGVFVAWERVAGFSYDCYIQHVLAGGTIAPGWPANGLLISAFASNQRYADVATDGQGGAFIAWLDNRGGPNRTYVAHVLASGAFDPFWTANGTILSATGSVASPVSLVTDQAGGALAVWYEDRPGTSAIYAHHLQLNGPDPTWPVNGSIVVSSTTFAQDPVEIADGTGGAFVAWEDVRSGSFDNLDVYVHHVQAAGVDAAWPVNGRAVCTAPLSQVDPVLALDGQGGVFAAWQDLRAGAQNDIYAGHLSSAGILDPSYPVNGRAVSLASNHQYLPSICGDGAGNAILMWDDVRSGTRDIYAQRLGRHGYLGTPEGEIVAVKDVLFDQGGQVKVSWNASPLDGSGDADLVAYDLYRSVPTALARRRLAGGSRVALSSLSGPPGVGQIVALPGSLATDYWEFVSTTNAAHFPSGYSVLGPTEGDSVSAGNPRTRFTVVARNANSSMYWPSAPDSGYSVDNLAPAAPSSITGLYEAGTTQIAWTASPEGDLDRYRLYRGTSADFVPDASNLIAEPTETSFDHLGPPASYYKLTAIDIHENEGPPILLSPSQTVDTPADALPIALALLPVRPQPARGTVHLEYHLPRAARVSLAIHDVAGRRMRVLADGAAAEAGVHRVSWDRAGAREGAGLYLAVLEVEGQRRVTRIVVVP